VHHSDEHFNTTTYMRQYWLESPLQSITVTMLVTIPFHFSDMTLYYAYLFTALWAFLTHMDVRLELGRFTCLLTGPQLHRLHHSIHEKHRDKNFAQLFPLLDILFGTYVPPEKGEFPPTGLISGERIATWRDLLLAPFRAWGQLIRKKAA
jgi:sterol desaturase/sphingolipid hydroxylase (fatty acid hydroxylase superfamily)